MIKKTTQVEANLGNEIVDVCALRLRDMSDTIEEESAGLLTLLFFSGAAGPSIQGVSSMSMDTGVDSCNVASLFSIVPVSCPRNLPRVLFRVSRVVEAL
jgi:hypothetical protein